MAAMSTWMEYLVDYVRPFFANQGGPVSNNTFTFALIAMRAYIDKHACTAQTYAFAEIHTLAQTIKAFS